MPRRRTLATGILPYALSMLPSLRHRGFARPATPAPGAQAAPRSVLPSSTGFQPVSLSPRLPTRDFLTTPRFQKPPSASEGIGVASHKVRSPQPDEADTQATLKRVRPYVHPRGASSRGNRSPAVPRRPSKNAHGRRGPYRGVATHRRGARRPPRIRCGRVGEPGDYSARHGDERGSREAWILRYSVEVVRGAQKQLERIPADVQERFLAALECLG